MNLDWLTGFVNNMHEGFDSGREKKKLEKQQYDEAQKESIAWVKQLSEEQKAQETKDHGNLMDAREQERKDELHRIKVSQEEAKLENIKNPKPTPTTTPTTTTTPTPEESPEPTNPVEFLKQILGIEYTAPAENTSPTPTATPTATPTPEEFLLDYAPYIEDQSKIDKYYPNGIPQPSKEMLDIIRQVSPNDATRSGIINLTEAGYNMNPADYTGNSNGTIDRGTNMINSGTFDWLKGTPYDEVMSKSGIENYGDMFDPMKNENMKDIIRKVQGYKAWYGPRDKGFKHGL